MATTSKYEIVTLILKNIIFTILQPGLVAGLIPFLLLGEKFTNTFESPLGLWQWIAMMLFLIGLTILIYCVALFAFEGKGTLSPAVPTTALVTIGLYKYSRNPMYIGVILMLVGEAILFEAGILWLYTLVVFIAFNLFIILHEEPRLKKVFGKNYEQYMKRVRRWL